MAERDADGGRSALDMPLSEVIAESNPKSRVRPPPSGRAGRGRRGGPEHARGRAAPSTQRVPARGRGQGRRSGRAGPQGRGALQPGSATEHRLHEEVWQEQSGDSVLALHGIEIVRAKASGEIVLHSGNLRGGTLLRSIGDALRLLGFELRDQQQQSANGDWNVTNGRGFLRRFHDGMVIPPLGQAGPGRAQVMLETMRQRIENEKRKHNYNAPTNASSSRFTPY